MENTTKERAVAYVRVSTTEQAERGYSIDAQIQTIKDYCQRSGLQLTQIYADKGISGKSLKKRVKLQQLIVDAKEDKFDRVVVWKNSRLARNVKLLLEIVDTLQTHNIEFDSISENIKIDTASGKFMLQMMASVSEFERNETAENVRLGMRKRAREGYKNGNRVLGYDNVKTEDGTKILAVNEDEASIIRFIFDSYIQQRGLRAIANELNHRGYRTKRDNAFSTTAVHDILNNPLYVGKIQYAKYEQWELKRRKGRSEHPIVVEGKHEAIISQDVWERTQRRLKVQKRTPKWNHLGTNVLTGLLRCPECGGAMIASNTTNTLKDGTKKRIRYYSCANFRSKGSAVCHANSIRADEAEKLVALKLRMVLSNPEVGQVVVQRMKASEANQRKSLDEIIVNKQRDIEALTQKLRRLQSTIDEEPTLKSDLEPRIHQLLGDQVELESELRELRERDVQSDSSLSVKNVTQLLKLIAEVVQGRDTDTLKYIYQCFIEKITFDRKKKLVWVHMRFDSNVTKELAEYTKAMSDEGIAFLHGRSIHLTI
ncbi:recombinase family protein [Levilactobacillus yiduensis]|uniref:recombinase family protein n=1 Tax=Levilactobacillus yiduensis TaxID=2953880 RepID=UPI00215871AC|nr:recombinase family protein [Levilactobacillus yiduensis]